MRKSIGILAIVAIMCLSGAALAYGGQGRGHGDRPFGGEKFRRPSPAFGQGGGRFDRGREGFRVNVPQTIRNKIEEARKLQDNMRAEMRKAPFNRTRVLQLRERSLRLRREVSDWFFTQRLDALEKAYRDSRK